MQSREELKMTEEEYLDVNVSDDVSDDDLDDVDEDDLWFRIYRKLTRLGGWPPLNGLFLWIATIENFIVFSIQTV